MGAKGLLALVAILAVPGLAACASATMTAGGPDLHDACVLEFGKDGKPKRVAAEEVPMQTIRLNSHDVKVRRVFGTRIVLRGSDATQEPACSASGAPNVG
jgi:hypothetical protein